jgi:general secretion pathway protein G
MDPTAFLGAYFSGIRDVLDSAETLDAALRLDGNALELALVLTNAEGSALSNFGSKEKTELRALAGLLDLEAGMSLLMGMDPVALSKRFQPMLESLLAAYPEALRPALKYCVEHMPELYGFAGSAQAGSMDFTPSGMRYRAYSRGGDPQKLLETYRKLDELVPGVAFTDIPERELAGAKVRGLRVAIDLPALMEALGKQDLPEGVQPQFDSMLEKFFGKDGLSIQVATREGTAVMVFGGDEEYLRASIARITSKNAPPPYLARALQQVGDLNPCMIVRYDLGRMMGGMKDLVGALVPGGTSEFPSFALSLTAWGGVDGRIWRGALVLDLNELAALAQLGRAASAPATRARVVADILSITMSLEEYAINNGGRYPDALEVLVVKDSNGVAYLDTADGKLPKDPWGNEYKYEPGTQGHPQPRVFSLGSDGLPGGTGEAADIDSDTLDQGK